MARFLGIFLIFLFLNALFVTPHFSALGFLNEDTDLIAGAVAGSHRQGLMSLFYTSYGPRVIRPLQLIGMFLEYSLFGTDPFPSQCISLILIALSQSILFGLLKKVVGIWGAALAVLWFSFSAAAGEARYWLSNRHDLYLLLFFSLALAAAYAFFEKLKLSWKSLVGFATIQSVFYWGCFYSNEKGSAVPAVTCALAAAAILVTCSFRSEQKYFLRWSGLVFLSLVNTAAYFALRNAVLGEFIGGYNSSLLPPQGFTWDVFRSWSFGILSAPFRQLDEQLAIFCLLLATPTFFLSIAVSFGGAIRRDSKLPWCGCFFACLAALYLSSLPTLQYNLSSPAVGALNARTYWFPAILGSIMLGVALGAALYNFRHPMLRGALLCVFATLLGLTIYGGRLSLINYGRAAHYSRQVVQAYQTYCACYDGSGTQFTGLGMFPFGVNGFTERGWLAAQASFAGMPACGQDISEAERNCQIQIIQTEKGAEIAPVRMSPSRIVALWDDAPLDIFSSSAPEFKSFRHAVNAFPEAAVIAQGGMFQISGWARERKGAVPIQLVALLADDQVLLATRPNAERDARLSKRLVLKKSQELYGFSLVLDAATIPAHAKTIRLCVAGKSAAFGGRWAKKCLATVTLSKPQSHSSGQS